MSLDVSTTTDSRSRSPPGSSAPCYIAFILVPAGHVLRPVLGAGRGGLPDALHARHDGGRGRGAAGSRWSSGPTTRYALDAAAARRGRAASDLHSAAMSAAQKRQDAASERRSSTRSRRSPRRSSPAPVCRRSRARPRTPSSASVVVLDGAAQRARGRLPVPRGRARGDRVEQGSEALELRVADESGRRAALPHPRRRAAAALLRMVGTLIGLELRPRAGPGARERGGGRRLPRRPASRRKLTDRENILARGEELGCDLSDGASVLVVRARPQHAEEGDWRARVLDRRRARRARRRARGAGGDRSSSARPARDRRPRSASTAARARPASW